jgi:hypothetical protein
MRGKNMLLTVEEIKQIYALLQEYPDATEVDVYNDYDEESLVLVVEFRANAQCIGTIRFLGV